MSDRTDTLVELLEPFGLEAVEASIYLVLLEFGGLSALEISRKLHFGRTRVYRLLDKLIGKGLVIQQTGEAGFRFLAAEPAKLKLLLDKQEGEMLGLKRSLPSIVTELEQHKGGGLPGSKVLYYHGQTGLSQVNWHLIQAKDELLSYEVATADAYLPKKEAEDLRRALVEAKIKCRNIYNQKYIQPFTEVEELVTKWWEVRQVDPSIMEIRADVFIYNDVYAMCHYLGGKEVFCVEIINPYLARMQKQLFELVWRQARKMAILSPRGEARVVD